MSVFLSKTTMAAHLLATRSLLAVHLETTWNSILCLLTIKHCWFSQYATENYLNATHLLQSATRALTPKPENAFEVQSHLLVKDLVWIVCKSNWSVLCQHTMSMFIQPCQKRTKKIPTYPILKQCTCKWETHIFLFWPYRYYFCFLLHEFLNH